MVFRCHESSGDITCLPFQVADKRVLKEARGGDVWSVSGQGGSLAGDPEGASVHPVGLGLNLCLYVLLWCLYWTLLHL